MSNRTTGGYPSGDKPVSELKPPLANISKPGLRAALLNLCDEVERDVDAYNAKHSFGKDEEPVVDTSVLRDLIAQHDAPGLTPRMAPGVPRWFGYEDR